MVDSTATYICEPRYSLVGEANRTCLETGTWNGAEATCECELVYMCIGPSCNYNVYMHTATCTCT